MGNKRVKETKRVNGSGSVSELKDGRHLAIATIDGKRIYRYRQTRLEAELALAGLLSGNEPPVARSRVSIPKAEDGRTLRIWAEEWLRASEGRLRPSTAKSYRRDIDRVIPIIGDMLITDLTPVRLQAVFTELRRKEVGERGIQQAYTVLRTCLQAAVRMDLITVNGMDRVDKPAWRPNDRQYWTVPQTRHFLDVALASPLRLAPLCALLASTGLRVSEALGLTWEDVDLDRKRLSVRRAAVWMNGECSIVPPKTKAGERTVSLTIDALAALRKVEQCTGPVFRTEGDCPPRHAHIRETLLALCKEAKIPPLNVHGLRHVAAATALKATKDIHAVQRMLGHSRASITMDIYAYVLTDESDVANALDAMLGQTAMPQTVDRQQRLHPVDGAQSAIPTISRKAVKRATKEGERGRKIYLTPVNARFCTKLTLV